MRSKEEIRDEVGKRLLQAKVSSDVSDNIPPFEGQEDAARLLRTLDIYIKARRVFVPPDYAQYHVRLNVLRDGKILLMATPGLREGFYQIDESVPEHKWSRAITASGVIRYGKRLYTSYEQIGKVDLLITGARAVDIYGNKIGKGTGYFDWEYSILREIGSVDETTPIIAVVHKLQVYEEILPHTEKDVSVDYIVTPEEVIKVENPAKRPKGIDWEYVNKNKKLLKQMRPLRELHILKSKIS